MNAEKQALLDHMNELLDRTVETVVEALTENDREFAIAALGAAVLLMNPAQLADLAFAATLRLVDQEAANRE